MVPAKNTKEQKMLTHKDEFTYTLSASMRPLREAFQREAFQNSLI